MTMTGKATLAPSILTADFSKLGEAVTMFERHPSVGYIHFDVMDGDFVPNISFGAPVVRSLAGKTKLPFDVHLMVTEPARYVRDFVTENTEYIVVHQEAALHLDRTLRLIKSLGVKCGAALNPATPEESLEYVLELVDQVLVMSVNPGFGGQQFIPSSIEKICRLADMRTARGLDFKIAADGGVNRGNIKDVVNAGADIVVAGSSVMNAEDPEKELAFYDGLLCGAEDAGRGKSAEGAERIGGIHK
ncbi:MAG: ribulose-phosphate 3-epimerase [Clostridiales Family XIII bacterium]|nr:ribulose-phosphate 3-epimerase [Clostridiales Family XIII bacterium]